MRDIDEQLQGIEQLVDRGRFTKALERLGALTVDTADDGYAWQLRGMAHFGLAEYGQAMTAFEHASLLVPLCVEAQSRLAACYMASRRRNVAAVIYEHLATLEMLPEDVVEAVSAGLATTGKHEAALRFCLTQLQQFRGNHKLLYAAAAAMRKLDYDTDEILPLAYQAHRLQPDNVSYRIAFAQHLVSADRSSEAARVLRGIDLDELQCIPSLQRLRLLFESLNELDGAAHCRARLEQIGYELSSTYRAPRNTDPDTR